MLERNTPILQQVPHALPLTPAQTMRALVLAGPGALLEENVAVPETPEDGVLLKTRAVSICSTDVSYYHGNLISSDGAVILDHEYVGEIVDVGQQMSPDLLGRRLSYFGQTDFGGFAEFRAIRPVFPGERKAAPFSTRRWFKDDERAAAVLVPDTISDCHAPLVEPITAVLRAILHHPPHIGARVLILGGGPCGAIAGRLLQHCFGVETISLLEHNPERAAIARANYADDVFSSAEELSGAVSSRAKFDYVFDALPPIVACEDSCDPRRAAMRAAVPGGRYVLYGASETLQKFDTWLLLAKGLSLHAAPFDVDVIPMAKTALVMKTALRTLESGTIDPSWIITREVHFTDTAAISWTFANHERNPDLKTVVRFD